MKAMIVAVAALGLAACNQTGSGMALDAAALDPTGLSSHVANGVSEARSTQQEKEMEERGVDLGQIGVPLQEVAQGKTARPNFMAGIKGSMTGIRNQMAAQQAMSIAKAVVGGAMGGGLGLVAAAPGIAMQAATTGAMMGMIASSEAEMDRSMVQFEAQRAAERAVPDEDRSSEAQAILTIANGPSGRSASWQNPQTGSSGKVTMRKDTPIEGGMRCRSVEQEWKRGGETAKGNMAICLQDGVWYDLS